MEPRKKEHGLAITFQLPFPRRDLWAELHAPRPLGVIDAVEIDHLPRTSDGWTLQIEAGSERKVVYKGRTTVSRLVCIEDDMVHSFEIWEVVSQDASALTLVGGSNGTRPRTSIYMSDAWTGRNMSGEVVGTVVAPRGVGKAVLAAAALTEAAAAS